MKHKGSIIIDQPLEKVVALFLNSENLKKWQEGLVKKELISGTENKMGAVSLLYYKTEKYEMELTERIIENNLPESLEAIYQHKHMDNTMKYSFKSIGKNQTQYSTEVVYTRIDWVMPRLMSILFPRMYTKPGERWMRNFKIFVEQN